jgi:hypothetical protein
MKNTFLSICLAAITGNAMAQSSDVQQTTFSKIIINGKATVLLKQGETSKYEYSDERVRPDVKNEKLVINGGPGTITVTVKELSQIEIPGDGTIIAEEKMTANNLKIDISGSGKITFHDLQAGELKSNISGIAKLKLSGESKKAEFNISGSGNADAISFKTPVLITNISGAGKITMDVTDELEANISGSGSVKYVNTPAKITRSISGIGKIGPVSGSETSSVQDSVEVNLGDQKIVVIEKDSSTGVNVTTGNKKVVSYSRSHSVQPHWAGFELGFNQLFSEPFNTDMPAGYEYMELNSGKSIAVNLNLFDYGFKIYRHHLQLVTGLGITWNNWRFQNDVYLVPNQPMLTGVIDSVPMRKSKLTASYATLPLLFEFNSHAMEKKSFHIAAGIIGSYRIGTHTKRVYTENGKKRKVKDYDDFSLDPFHAAATLRVGYRGFTLFATYGLMPLFKTSQAPDLKPFTVGIALLNW